MESHIIVIGGSAGSLEPIKKLLSLLPADLNAPVLIVVHMARHMKSLLPSILHRHSKLPIITPMNGEKLKKGHVYVCVPNRHMKVKDGKITLENGPVINHCRPAIDPLFYSAAEWHGSCAIGVLLSGFLDDGTAGLLAIKHNHGIAIVQHLEEAEYSDMPQNALCHVEVDFCLKVAEIVSKLVELVNRPLPPIGCFPKRETFEQYIAIDQKEPALRLSTMDKMGHPSGFSCPICQGVLWEVNSQKVLRFRCQVGHVFSIKCLTETIEEKTENILWSVLRALEEKENLAMYIEANVSANQDKKNILRQLRQNMKQQMEAIHHILKNENSVLEIF